MNTKGTEYITLKEWAEARGIDPVLVRQRARRGTAPEGMIKVGNTWMLPKDAEAEDKRITSGKYIGQRRNRG